MLVLCFFDISFPDLDNCNLFYQKDLDVGFSTLLRLFLYRLAPPVCLVAHNGLNYDFPLLRTELNRIGQELPGDILCADTLQAFRCLDEENKCNDTSNACVQQNNNMINNSDKKEKLSSVNVGMHCMMNARFPPKKRLSYKLQDVYKRVMGKKMEGGHQAENDCLALVCIFRKIFLRICPWFEGHAIMFNEVKPMYKANPMRHSGCLDPHTFPYEL